MVDGGVVLSTAVSQQEGLGLNQAWGRSMWNLHVPLVCVVFSRGTAISSQSPLNIVLIGDRPLCV